MLEKFFSLDKDKIIFHLSLEKELPFATKIVELLFNPEKERWEKFVKKLKKYNNNGYNIYAALNEFKGNKRRQSDITAFRGIMIDIDVGDGDRNKKAEAYFDLVKRMQSIESTLGLKPKIINETYKGYHILFKFSAELNRLKLLAYKHIHKSLNTFLGGDTNFREVTGMLKVPGFIDHKENRNFLISTIQQNFGDVSEITLDTIRKHFYSEDVDVKTIIKRCFSKKEEKNNNQEIEELDAIEMIKRINKAHEEGRRGFKHRIKIQPDGVSIDKTNGLRLFLDDKLGRWTIKDFAQKGRYGNYYFFLNYYLPCSGVNINQRFNYLKAFFKREYGINVEQRNVLESIKNPFFTENDEIVAIPHSFLKNYLSGSLVDKNGKGIIVSDIKKYLKICDLRPLKLKGGISTHKKTKNSKKDQNLKDFEHIGRYKRISSSELPKNKIYFSYNGRLRECNFSEEYGNGELIFFHKDIISELLLLRSEEKIKFLLQTFLGYYLYGGFTMKLTAYKNKKYYYEILRDFNATFYVPDYLIAGDYLYIGSKEWIKNKKQK